MPNGPEQFSSSEQAPEISWEDFNAEDSLWDFDISEGEATREKALARAAELSKLTRLVVAVAITQNPTNERWVVAKQPTESQRRLRGSLHK